MKDSERDICIIEYNRRGRESVLARMGGLDIAVYDRDAPVRWDPFDSTNKLFVAHVETRWEVKLLKRHSLIGDHFLTGATTRHI